MHLRAICGDWLARLLDPPVLALTLVLLSGLALCADRGEGILVLSGRSDRVRHARSILHCVSVREHD